MRGPQGAWSLMGRRPSNRPSLQYTVSALIEVTSEHFWSLKGHLTCVWERGLREGISEEVTHKLSLKGLLSKQIWATVILRSISQPLSYKKSNKLVIARLVISWKWYHADGTGVITKKLYPNAYDSRVMTTWATSTHMVNKALRSQKQAVPLDCTIGTAASAMVNKKCRNRGRVWWGRVWNNFLFI